MTFLRGLRLLRFLSPWRVSTRQWKMASEPQCLGKVIEFTAEMLHKRSEIRWLHTNQSTL